MDKTQSSTGATGYIPQGITSKGVSAVGYVPQTTTQKPVSAVGYTPGTTQGIQRVQPSTLKNSQGLYQYAVQNGLQNEADKVMQMQTGEEVKRIFSGGFISDTFDVLNALQYGVTGMLKGKSFAEGVKTRQSFSDQDSLGASGLPGVLAGIALDIAVDPLTYLAPVTVLKKIPGLTKAAKVAKGAVFGEKVTKTLDATQDAARAAEIMAGHLEEAARKGGDIPEVISRTKSEMVENLRGNKLDGLASYVDEIDTTKISNLDDFRSVLNPVMDAGRTYQEVEGGTRLGKYLAQKLSWSYGKDPVFMETFERGIRTKAVSVESIVDMTRELAKLDPVSAAKLLTRGEDGRFIRVGLDKLRGVLSPEEFATVEKFYAKLDNLGQQAVELGILSKAKYEENLGEYIKNAYTEYELANKKNIFGISRTGIKPMKKRVEGLTTEKMKELGQIDNPAYLLFKSTFDLTKNVEDAKLLKEINAKFGSSVAMDGFVQIPKTAKYGDLGGKYIPQHMAEYLTDIITPDPNTIGKQIVANFKFFKVIMNPATHARNIASNIALNWFKLGMNPLDPRTIKAQALAMREITKRGGQWMKEAKPFGFGLDSGAASEMRNLLEVEQATTFGKGLGKQWGTIKKRLGDLYQGEENFAKLSAYIYNRTTKGLDPESAWKAAESATFNYAQVTPFVRKLRESLFGFPFITFTVKSTPLIAETMLKNPARIGAIGKIKAGIENLSDIEETNREKAAEPSWVKNGFYIKLPMKDSQGRSAYFDLTYILPFGDLMSGNFFEGGINRETGMSDSITTTMMKKSPFINLVSELGKNQDFYGNKIWKESDPAERQLGDLMRHLTKTMAPPPLADQIPGGYNDKGVRQQRGIIGSMTPQEKENQQRTLMQELLKNVGAKIQPIDADVQEVYQEWGKKKGLQSLLKERGLLNEADIYYQPK